MPLLGKQPIGEGITSFGTEVLPPGDLGDWLFQNKWTAKEFKVPGEGLSNNWSEGWVGGAAQVTERVQTSFYGGFEQSSLWKDLVSNKLIKPPLDTDWIDPEVNQPIGHQAIFYPKELMINYGMWINQVYRDDKGISAFTDLGNYTYTGNYYYPPTNLSQEKLGSTLAGLKAKHLIKG